MESTFIDIELNHLCLVLQRERSAFFLYKMVLFGHGNDVSKCMLSGSTLQPFSPKTRTPTIVTEFQIGLFDHVEADLEHFWDSCSAGFLGERLYM